jgi:hypothetical protein
MNKRRFQRTVGTKLPIAMVGRQIIPTLAEVVACNPWTVPGHRARAYAALVVLARHIAWGHEAKPLVLIHEPAALLSRPTLSVANA